MNVYYVWDKRWSYLSYGPNPNGNFFEFLKDLIKGTLKDSFDNTLGMFDRMWFAIGV